MIACPHCQKRVPKTGKFCIECGMSLVAPIVVEETTKKPEKQLISLKKASIALILIGIVLFFVLWGFPFQPSQQGNVQTYAGQQWITIKTFTGVGDKTTEDFHVSTNYWRVTYTVKAESEEFAGFYLIIYPSGQTGNYVDSIQYHKSGSDTSYIRAGPGDFYIKVLAANLQSWTIEVQIQQ